MIGLTMIWALSVATADSPSGVVALAVDPTEATIQGPEGRVQLVVSGVDGAGVSRDLTHDPGLVYAPDDPKTLGVTPTGEVWPVGDGRAKIRVWFQGLEARVVVRTAGVQNPTPVDFATEVVPVLTRLGCNAGACHGKASGQNGFRLSLLGSDPALDFESITRDARGRRISLAAPGSSLILRKPAAAVPHRGGRKLIIGSPEYQTLRRWLASGADASPRIAADESRVTLRLHPPSGRLYADHTQQLRVVARRGSWPEVDVTRLTRFAGVTPDLALVDADGRVRAAGGVGEAAVTASYAGETAVARFTVAAPATAGPPAVSPESDNLVDGPIFARLKALNLAVSPACTDAEFARRSSLDICGVLPEPREVSELERDGDLRKRARWVERLVDRPEYADRFAAEWSALLRNQRTLGTPSMPGTFAFHAWVREALAENRPYDQWVAELLTARGDPARNPAVVWYRQAEAPEERADDVAQLFLGVRLQCARCHKHPTDRWGPADYYGFASLFARVGRKAGTDPLSPGVYLLPEGRAAEPSTGVAHEPRVLGGGPLAGLGPAADPRGELVAWLRRPENPYFARALVNRYWRHFFGNGLVDPEDDFRTSNPPTNPELLDALADDFVRNGYDLKRLVVLLASSKTYDRSSDPLGNNGRDRRYHARFYPRRLPAEVLLDAVDRVAGVPRRFEGLPPGTRAGQLPDEGFDTPDRFLDVFGRPKRETVCGCERSTSVNLAQSLAMLNGDDVGRQIAHPDGRAARYAANGREGRVKVDDLYRVALARGPTAEERAVCLGHLAKRRAEGRLKEGFEDLIWTLINTKAFQTVE